MAGILYPLLLYLRVCFLSRIVSCVGGGVSPKVFQKLRFYSQNVRVHVLVSPCHRCVALDKLLTSSEPHSPQLKKKITLEFLLKKVNVNNLFQ